MKHNPVQKDVIKYQKDSFILTEKGQKGRAISQSENGIYRLVDEDISLPVAIIKQSALTNNLNWMQSFADHHQVKLSPHGKTSMTPDFFRQQLENGAWGITVATPAQAEIAAMAGAKRIIMANQLVGKTNMAIIEQLINEFDVDFYCCVDSSVNVQQLNQYFSNKKQTLKVLIEFGVPGGRCGCRSPQEVLELAQTIQDTPALSLAGIEVYEGVIHGDNAEQDIRTFLNQALTSVESLASDGLITGQPIITGAGSAWYDVVAECLANLTDYLAIIRPGCYAIHDTGIYLDAQSKVLQRAQVNQGYACELGGDLESALEVWAYVISRPEPTKLVVGLGKRDVAFDAGLPIAERGYRNGEAISVKGLTSTAVMDQHTFLETDGSSEIEVGDMIAFSTSHPCLTFDKWRYIAISDDEHQVTKWVETCF
ncbi:D-serine dehydratase [Vibrio crassostreae]|uniref:amino acid deaminase n=1 Tax=Vibrio crassostreae TaxID=246167 RepID=UPI0005E06C2F|nr:amino acid deaminase [Vibrio crassostreae]TCT65256.1 D-serine deaminase-like pyridoxal phosphate-dependent protein [Vibrio crassostreae]TCT76668.1 D-serine deaminase-like pyridoxal phosphate-dependent protein [Vibrio crassostreae]TCT85463.1 D-serine deaminase-like pyridoxal phosphate-dependent protein [Vibrio crassostreae]TCU06603.1 D-serine deaminase-like pyridoxal phosphate-dependent protein [Vibrio crassostreae]TDW11013.1 D-serine deaminase-like pyridoxal phosphate-dependent protein [Vib